MNVSITWDDDANMGKHSCYAWLDTVTDGCDTDNGGDGKHGGQIFYESQAVTATVKIEPLVMKRMWDNWQDGSQECSSIDNKYYMDQETLSINIDDFCKQSAAAQPNGIAESERLSRRSSTMAGRTASRSLPSGLLILGTTRCSKKNVYGIWASSS
jgi:hypothetical protein